MSKAREWKRQWAEAAQAVLDAEARRPYFEYEAVTAKLSSPADTVTIKKQGEHVTLTVEQFEELCRWGRDTFSDEVPQRDGVSPEPIRSATQS